MGSYIVRRVLLAIPAIFLVTLIIFFLVVASGNPFAQLEDKGNVSQNTIAHLKEEWHVGEPVLERYFLWLGDLVQGDLGVSILTNQSVASELGVAAWNTLQLFLGWFILSTLIAIGLGVYSGSRPYSLGDYAATGGSFLGFSAPTFFWGLLLQFYLGLWLLQATGVSVFYVFGRFTPGEEGNFLNYIQHYVLPVAVLTIVTVASWSRYMRSSVLDVVNADYVRTARAKGLTRRQIIRRHAVRNAVVPLIAVMGVEAGAFLGGAIVTEQIFAWPGMGQLFFTSVSQTDFPVVMAWLVVSTIAVIVFNLIADIVVAWVDPRIQYD